MSDENGLAERIRALLESKGIPFEEIEHAPGQSCEESARNRKTSLSMGAKSLLLKDRNDFHLFVLSASRKLDSSQARKILGSSKLRFATPEELWEQAKVEKGALPPFGKGLLPFDLYVDNSVWQREEMVFNAGVLTRSFRLFVPDYKRVVSPRFVGDFSS